MSENKNNDNFQPRDESLVKPDFAEQVKQTFGTPQNPIMAIAGDIQKNVHAVFNLNRNMKRAKIKVQELNERVEQMEAIIEDSTKKDFGNRLDHLR